MRPYVEEAKRLKLKNFRISDPDWDVVVKYFDGKRVPVTTGIRMILMEFLKREGVLK
jgi:hypothetical protein